VIYDVDIASMVLGGLAAGMVLFIVSVGLSVTMGLMGFVNLAHGAFAMLGGYVTVTLAREAGVPFLLALVIAFFLVGAVSVAFERALYRPHYRTGELDQVLMTIGLVFISVALVTLVWGPDPFNLTPPDYLRGQVDAGFRRFPAYRVFIIAAGAAMIVALYLGFERTRIGAQIRAAVDNRRMAESLGVDVARLFTLTFALGSGLAALGGGIGAEILGLDPQYPLRYLAYVLIVVAVGGLGRVTGVFAAALLIGVLDFVLKVQFPKGGTMFIYALAIVLLLLRPQGLAGRKA
jgi:branched-chain amino acid transport system permease protein